MADFDPLDDELDPNAVPADGLLADDDAEEDEALDDDLEDEEELSEEEELRKKGLHVDEDPISTDSEEEEA